MRDQAQRPALQGSKWDGHRASQTHPGRKPNTECVAGLAARTPAPHHSRHPTNEHQCGTASRLHGPSQGPGRGLHTGSPAPDRTHGVGAQEQWVPNVGPEETVPDSVERLACANRKVPGGRLHQFNAGPTTRPALPPTPARMKVPAPFAPLDSERVVEARQGVRCQLRVWSRVIG